VPSPSPGLSFLRGVAATSASNAWAVGCSTVCATTSAFMKPLILRWNGKTWQRMPGPAIAGGGALAGVAATSARQAWAVGETGSVTAGKTVILRWNGSVWKRVSSPSPGANSGLSSAAAISGSNALAVGGHGTSTPHTLTLHWSGTSWK
jgi:hypothetical protein